MKRFLRTIVVMAAMMAVQLACVAQTITDQTQFVVTKGNGSVNIRKAPNTKAAKVGSLGMDETLPVLAEQDGWYQVCLTDGKTGWISQTVCRISDAPLDVTKICDHVYGTSGSYDEYNTWMVAQVKGTDMFVAITNASNTDEPISVPWRVCLWLGKKVGNTLVFDQYVPFSTSYDMGDSKRFEIFPSDYYEDGYELFYGDKYTMPDNQGGITFRPSTLTLETIKKLFNGKQKKDRKLFLAPAMFGKKYANVVLG